MSTDLQVQNPEGLIQQAIASGASIDVLERLMALRERYMAEVKKESFFKALAEFQKLVPEIKKDKNIKYETKSGPSVDYWYAPLASVIRQIKEPLAKVGMAYQWKQEEKDGVLTVHCELVHQGHTERSTLSGPLDTSGSKNAIQAKGSTVEYLRRYTLTSALGLSTMDDPDGRIPKATVEEIEIKATSAETKAELKALWDSLAKDQQASPHLKKVFKDHETVLKKLAAEVKHG